MSGAVIIEDVFDIHNFRDMQIFLQRLSLPQQRPHLNAFVINCDKLTYITPKLTILVGKYKKKVLKNSVKDSEDTNEQIMYILS